MQMRDTFFDMISQSRTLQDKAREKRAKSQRAEKSGHLAKCKRISCDGHCQWPNCPVKQETKKRERKQRVEESNSKKKEISNKRKLLEILKDNARLKSNNNITSLVRGNHLLLILRNYSWTRSCHC